MHTDRVLETLRHGAWEGAEKTEWGAWGFCRDNLTQRDISGVTFVAVLGLGMHSRVRL